MITVKNMTRTLACGLTLGLLTLPLFANAEKLGKSGAGTDDWTISLSGDPTLAWTGDGRYKLSSTSPYGTSRIRIYDREMGQTRTLPARGSSPFAWREDNALFAALHRSPSGMRHIQLYDPADGYVVMSATLPRNIYAIREVRWVPHTDNVVFFAQSGQGWDVYYTDAGIVKPLTTTHDVLGMTVSSDGNEVTWARGRSWRTMRPTSVYSMDLNNLSVEREEEIKPRVASVNRPSRGMMTARAR